MSAPIRYVPTEGGLDIEAVLTELQYPNTWQNVRSIMLGKSLVRSVRPRRDGSFLVRETPESDKDRLVNLGRAVVGSPSPVCTCDDWARHNLALPMNDVQWLCPHGAAVLLAIGLSETYMRFSRKQVEDLDITSPPPRPEAHAPRQPAEKLFEIETSAGFRAVVGD